LEEISCYPENNDAKELKRILTQPHFMVSKCYCCWGRGLLRFFYISYIRKLKFSKFSQKSAGDETAYNTIYLLINVSNLLVWPNSFYYYYSVGPHYCAENCQQFGVIELRNSFPVFLGGTVLPVEKEQIHLDVHR